MSEIQAIKTLFPLKNCLAYSNAVLLHWLNARISDRLRSRIYQQLLSVSDRLFLKSLIGLGLGAWRSLSSEKELQQKKSRYRTKQQQIYTLTKVPVQPWNVQFKLLIGSLLHRSLSRI